MPNAESLDKSHSASKRTMSPKIVPGGTRRRSVMPAAGEESASYRHRQPASDITTEALLARFTRHQKTRLRATTFERLGGTLRTLQAHLPTHAKAITKRVVADYIDDRSRTVKPGTVAKEIGSLRLCLRLAVEWGLLPENAASRAMLPKLDAVRTRYLTPSEFHAALEIAPPWLRAPMAFAVCTGIRRGEMLSLRWADVDRKNQRLYLRETKNDSLRSLPLSDAALLVLNSLPPGLPSDVIFAAVEPGRLSVTTRRIFQRLGIMDASLNTLRHTSASWLVQQGVDLHSVGQLLGHKTPRMTQRYAHLFPESPPETALAFDEVMGNMLAAMVPKAAAQADTAASHRL